MKKGSIIRELEQIAGRFGLRVRYEAGNFRGGRCMVGEQEMIVLNKHHSSDMHLAVLAESLHGLPVEHLFMRPVVRAALEEVWAENAPLPRTFDHA